MKSISPVFTEKEKQFEFEIAKDHPQYEAVIGLRVTMQLIDAEKGTSQIIDPWGTAVRFQLSDDERAAVAAGKDLILTQLNFGAPITPMNIQFVAAGEKPFFGALPTEQANETTQGLSLVPKSSESPTAADESLNSEGRV